MTLAVWMLVLAAILSGAVAGVFVMLVIGIHIGDRAPHLAGEPDARLDALTRSTLGAGVRTNCPAGNRHAEGA